MKFVESTHLADPDVSVRKLVEIANAVEAVQERDLREVHPRRCGDVRLMT